MSGNDSDLEEERAGGVRGSVFDLPREDREALHRLAWEAIRYELETEEPFQVHLERFSPLLREPGAVFVTLKVAGRLRGCIGTLSPRRALAEDVAHNARAAAFRDPRFSPLSGPELPTVDLHLSILTPLVPLEVESREELLKALRPGVDGLVLHDPPHRSTFLPQVWESLPEPNDFVSELFVKGGLPRDHWSSTLEVHRYSIEEI
jgi:AmmeMemoRadiSam system protein A